MDLILKLKIDKLANGETIFAGDFDMDRLEKIFPTIYSLSNPKRTDDCNKYIASLSPFYDEKGERIINC